MTIEIVDFPIENGDFHSYVKLPEGSLSGRCFAQIIWNDSKLCRICFMWAILRGLCISNFQQKPLQPGKPSSFTPGSPWLMLSCLFLQTWNRQSIIDFSTAKKGRQVKSIKILNSFEGPHLFCRVFLGVAPSDVRDGSAWPLARWKLVTAGSQEPFRSEGL